MIIEIANRSNTEKEKKKNNFPIMLLVTNKLNRMNITILWSNMKKAQQSAVNEPDWLKGTYTGE